jgi:hypothetical protein
MITLQHTAVLLLPLGSLLIPPPSLPALLLLLLLLLQAAVGGRLRVFLSGGAPLPQYAQDFMQVCMCTPVLQVTGGQPAPEWCYDKITK